MTKTDRAGLVSDIPELRSSLIEIVLLALGVALGVNLISNAIYSALPTWAAVCSGIVIILLPILYVIRVRFRAVRHRREIEGFFMYDSEENEAVDVPEYSLAEAVPRYLSAAFAENPALRRQWETEPRLSDWDPPRKGQQVSPAGRLIQELMEYILLDSLSTSLTDYFNGAPDNKLATYHRNDLPDVLLKNRFLELFSRDPADREGFGDMGPSEEGWVVVSAYNATGGHYNQFQLKLPSDSKMRRADDGSIEITGRAMTVRLSVEYRNYSAGAASWLAGPYIDGDVNTLRALQVNFWIDVTVKRRIFLRNDEMHYLRWVEEVLERLEYDLSGSAFLKRINWDTLQAAIQVFNRPPGIGTTGRTKAASSDVASPDENDVDE